MSTFENWMREFPLSQEQIDLSEKNRQEDEALARKESEKELEIEMAENTDKNTDNGSELTEAPEPRINTDFENVERLARSLEAKPWRLVDAREGFNIYSNMKVQADHETNMLKTSISIVFGYIETLSAWNQSSSVSNVLTIVIAAILLCANDFSDELKLYMKADYNYDQATSDYLTLNIKIACSVFLIIGLFLSFLQGQADSKLLKEKIASKKGDILKSVYSKNNYSKFLIDTNFKIQPNENRCPVMDFVKAVTNTDVEYIRQTFIGQQDCIQMIDDVEQMDNIISYSIRDMQVIYKMHANGEADRYFIEQTITLPPAKWTLKAQREEIKRNLFVFVFNRETSLLKVQKYTLRTQKHEDDVREFTAFRNVYNATLDQPEANLNQIIELKKQIVKMQMAMFSAMKTPVRNVNVNSPRRKTKFDFEDSDRAAY